jgi:cytochrome c
MDSFELNKIAGALLGSLLAVLGINKVMGTIYGSPEEGATKAYVVEGVETQGPAPTGGAPQAQKSLAELLAEATPEAGKRVSAKCASCHTFEQGGSNKTGPNLWGVVNGPFAHKEDFSYSPAFQESHEQGRKWTDELLFQYLENPQKFEPGNKMQFAGLKKPEERANIIAYLHQQSNVPLQIDKAEAGQAAPK